MIRYGDLCLAQKLAVGIGIGVAIGHRDRAWRQSIARSTPMPVLKITCYIAHLKSRYETARARISATRIDPAVSAPAL